MVFDKKIDLSRRSVLPCLRPFRLRCVSCLEFGEALRSFGVGTLTPDHLRFDYGIKLTLKLRSSPNDDA